MLCFFRNRNHMLIRVLSQYKAKELFLTSMSSFFNTNSPHTKFLHVEGILIVIWMQPNTSIYIINDKKMAVHCYLQIDCGFVFICQDANSTIPLDLLCALKSIYQGFCGFVFSFGKLRWEPCYVNNIIIIQNG